MELKKTEFGLTIVQNSMELRSDFAEMLRRIRPEKLRHEKLARAAKIASDTAHEPIAVDATAGLGEDALILAAMGYRVIMFEKDETVALLLEDALLRAKNDSEPIVREAASRMELRKGDSIEALREFEFNPDLIYLDPMFPARRKTSLVKKKLQILQALENPCEDEVELLEAAISANPAKIIIKRPIKGPYLSGIKPDYSISGKVVRYDCIIRKSGK